MSLLDALRPVADIIRQYDAACAEAARVAEERLRALGIPGLSALLPSASPPAAPAPAGVETPSPTRKTAAVSPSTGKRRDGRVPHPCAGGCGAMVVGVRCRHCNGLYQAQRTEEKRKQGRASAPAQPAAAPVEDAPEAPAAPAPADAPIPEFSRVPELPDHMMAIMAARANGIGNKRADEAGEFLVIRLLPHQSPDGRGGFVAVTDPVPADVQIVERVFRRGADWFVTLPGGAEERIGRRQTERVIVPVSITRNGAEAHA
jgi:hypothetical protein